MKFEIVYFSGTGNTWWIVSKLKSALGKRGHEVKMAAYESKERDSFPTEDAELFGIAFPAYEGGAPLNMDKYAYEVNARKGLKCFVLTTYWMSQGPAAIDYARILEKRGMKLVLATGVKMPMNTRCGVPFMGFLARISRRGMPSRPEEIPEIKEKALKRIEAIAEALNKGRKIWDRVDPVNRRFRRWGHRKFNESWAIPLVNKGLGVSSACNQCGKCIKMCPVQNITMIDGEIRFNGRCIMCARCWVFCPENAIYIEGYPIERHYAGIDEGYKPPKVGNLGWNNGGT